MQKGVGEVMFYKTACGYTHKKKKLKIAADVCLTVMGIRIFLTQSTRRKSHIGGEKGILKAKCSKELKMS